MKFAAKRTWPDHPKSWERQGEAESLEAFALSFASDAGLGVGTEVMVVQKDSDDPAIELFRVTGVDPYTLGPAQPRPAGGAAAVPASVAAAAPAPAPVATPESAPSEPVGYLPVVGMVWSMGRIVVIIGGITAVLMFAIKFGRHYF